MDLLSKIDTIWQVKAAFSIDIFRQQDYPEYTSSISNSPVPEHDGYLADSEENADLSSLQAQIQQARNDAKKHQRRNEGGLESRKKESIGSRERKEIGKGY